jgi:hypothetical protein
MVLNNLSLTPKSVNFANIQISELGINASQVTGYFLNHDPGRHNPGGPLDPNANFNWDTLNNFNQLVSDDNAGFVAMDMPWTNGRFVWEILVCYVIPAINTPGLTITIGTHTFTTNPQVGTIASNGSCTVSKLGQNQRNP